MSLSRFFAVICMSSVLSAALFAAAQAAELSLAPEVKSKSAAEHSTQTKPQTYKVQKKRGADGAALKGAWQIEAIKGKRAVIGMRGTMPEIEFAAGSYHGQSGCNNFGGNFEVKGAKVAFTRPASTLMACPEPISEQEYALFKALPGVRAYRYAVRGHGIKISKNREQGNREMLQLLDGKGRAIIDLARK